MLPIKREKVDPSKLSPEEQRLFRLYGKIPAHKGLKKMQERKYFDSGDYALSKAGRAPQSIVGTAIPNPENIPHAGNSHNNGQKIISISPTNSTSPVNKESGLANDENTRVPDYEHLPVFGEEIVVDKTTTETTDEKVADYEQLPVSGEDTVVDETTTETTDEKVPEDEQLPGSGKEIVVDETTTETTDEKVPEDEQLPGSGKEIVVDETTTEIAKDEATGQGPAR